MKTRRKKPAAKPLPIVKRDPSIFCDEGSDTRMVLPQTCPDGMPIRPFDPKVPVMYDDGSRMVLPRKKS